MSHADQVDQFFALLEDEDIDFLGTQTHADVPVLAYRWSQNDTVARASLEKLIDMGKQVMEEMGLRRIVSKGRHLRGDTEDQRVKMTVLCSGGRSMYLLMTAGMPGAREKAKKINRAIAQQLEKRIRGKSAEDTAKT